MPSPPLGSALPPIGALGPARHSLGPKAHAETGEVAVGEGEGGYEDDVPRVVLKDHGQVSAGVDVAQQQQGHEHQPGHHQAWQPAAVLPRLWGPGSASAAGSQAHPGPQGPSGSALKPMGTDGERQRGTFWNAGNVLHVN